MGMKWLSSIILVSLLLGFPAMFAQAQEGHGQGKGEHAVASESSEAAAAEGTHGEGGEAEGGHGLSPEPVDIFWIGNFPITNSMLVSWIVALGLIVFAQLATRNMQEVPSGLQNFWEWMVESLYNFLESIIGHELVRKTFWLFATIFIFILFGNWIGLIPGVGTVGMGVETDHGFLVTEPWLRGANADMNMTFAMALIFFACWFLWAIQANGPIGFLQHIFAPKGHTTGLLKALMVIVFMAVGVLEVVSILFRPISLSFRLYGNIFAGENIMESMTTILPGFNWLIPIPFYFLELLAGFVQALVFMLLTAVFTMLICQSEEH